MLAIYTEIKLFLDKPLFLPDEFLILLVQQPITEVSLIKLTQFIINVILAL